MVTRGLPPILSKYMTSFPIPGATLQERPCRILLSELGMCRLVRTCGW